ncbi:hypothetical protein MP228_003197 [Amoeboaphelidium protococcarum]|nr:hypothetical protein MP228_003197 [Amoeboaphelidium protococcarum]
MILPPINLQKWVSENMDKLKPPIGNYCVYRSPSGVPQSETENDPAGFIVMVVGGPNKRSDYHINPTEEWFYQYKGAVSVHVVEKNDVTGASEFKEIVIGEGDMFLLPGGIPHNPVRGPDTIGLVIERHRPVGKLDKMRWYCGQCREIVYEEAFQCVDLGTQLKPVVEKYYAHPELRTCRACGNVNQIPS